ncbi:FHA domain-containing protein [Candidatus Obscuribacterales bacterium]|jgi:pSer/pThr/pTyr-binding forkhead associated (FHA) protein|nr:FHA domain-containing protein [Candidatus Obscuribacterales bacterium]MBX3136958.1 FHA domain-containing protein [Candidatus Obscuribacterales bacterium]MBX3149844.1 FHA domain-containing protein [Candidatus Obscuribacterales bacterium]
MDNEINTSGAAFLLDLESQRKIPVVIPVCRVGRDIENDIVLADDTSISRFHSVIKRTNDEYSVEDAESRNGTFVNGTKVTGPVKVVDGDTLKLGNITFWFVIEAETESIVASTSSG